MPDVLCPLLVGRDEEQRELGRALDRLATGTGATVVLAGEPGVGKSRLVHEATAEATRRGACVLTGRALERDSPLAFRPVAEALHSHLRKAGLPQAAELAPFRPILGLLVPEWRRPGESPSEESLVVVGEAVLRLLTILGKASGCVVVFEDLQWADEESLDVIEYLADNISAEPILVLASLRNEEPSAAWSRIRRLVARRSASLLQLRPLTNEEVVSVAAGCLRSSTVSPDLADVVVAGSDGLPFLVEELLAAMVQARQLRNTPDGWALDRSEDVPVPATFAETVRRRLDALPGSRELLGAAALLGRSFDWRLLSDMTGQDEATMVDRLRGAADAHVLSVESTDADPRFQFRHALTRAAILGELLPPVRARLAAGGLEAVEAAHPGLPGEWCELAAELAEQSGNPDRAASLRLEAGRRALARGALASAEAQLQRARRQVGDGWSGVEIDETLCEVLVAAGDGHRVGDLGARVLSELAKLAAPAARRARVHVWLARMALVSAEWAAARHHLDQARSFTVADGRAAPELKVLDARVALGEDRSDEADGFGRAALAAAEAAEQPEVVCEAYHVLGQRERQRDLTAADDAFTAMLAVAEQHGLTLWRVRALHELGTLDLLAGGSLDRLAHARQAALDAGALSIAATVALQMGAWCVNHADPEGACDAGRSCAREAQRLKLPLLAGLGFVLQAVAYALRDERVEMEQAIEHALSVSDDHREVRGVVALQAQAVLALVREDRAQMVAALDTGVELLRGTPVTAPNRGLWALVHALVGDGGEAAVADVDASGLTVYWLVRGWVGHARAVLLGRQGRAAEAAEWFARADSDLAPCDWYRHHARRLVAEAALADGWGEPTGWLTEALTFFDSDGPPAVASACRSLLRQAGVPVPRRRRPAPDLPAVLAAASVTPRELEVLRLLADGCSTREIAARLFVSPKTVERHVANLVDKVGVDGRSGLVAFAARHLGAR